MTPTADTARAGAPVCGGFAALGRCDKPSKYRVRSTAGTRTVYCCGVHLAQVVKRFLHDWDLAAEVSCDVES